MRTRVEQPGFAREGRLYGRCAFALGVFLVWYAGWTIACNALVLTGFHYRAFPWATLPPSLLVLALIPFSSAVLLPLIALVLLATLPAASDLDGAVRRRHGRAACPIDERRLRCRRT